MLYHGQWISPDAKGDGLVLIAGFDGLDIAHYYNPTITTIRQPVEDMAVATIKILFDMIRNKAQNQRKVFQGELVIGESTKVVN